MHIGIGHDRACRRVCALCAAPPNGRVELFAGDPSDQCTQGIMAATLQSLLDLGRLVLACTVATIRLTIRADFTWIVLSHVWRASALRSDRD
jgi:hypothetical protein